MTRVYLDGIFDLYHRGHLESFKKCLQFGDQLVIGVVSDKDAEGYKRKPITSGEYALKVMRVLEMVDKKVS